MVKAGRARAIPMQAMAMVRDRRVAGGRVVVKNENAAPAKHAWGGEGIEHAVSRARTIIENNLVNHKTPKDRKGCVSCAGIVGKYREAPGSLSQKSRATGGRRV